MKGGNTTMIETITDIMRIASLIISIAALIIAIKALKTTMKNTRKDK